MVQTLNLRQIEVFATIMRTGSVTEAAKTLNVSQPSISKVLKHTEYRLGFDLFKRIRGRLYPTPEAEILYTEATRINEDVTHLNQLAFELTNARIVRLKIGCPPSLSSNILPLAVKAFRSKYPDIGVQLTVTPSTQIRSEIIQRRVDLSLAHFPTPDPEIDGQVLRSGRMVCLMLADHVLATKSIVNTDNLIKHNYINYYADQEFLRLIDNTAPQLLKNAKSDLRVNYFSLAISLAQRGLGIALVDEFAIDGKQLENLAIIPFEPEIVVQMGVIFPRYKPLSAAATQFIETLVDLMQAAPYDSSNSSIRF